MEELLPCPDYIPNYLLQPQQRESYNGGIRKEYEDGVVTYISPSGNAKTEFNDSSGSVHYERTETGQPKFLPTGSWFEYYITQDLQLPPAS